MESVALAFLLEKTNSAIGLGLFFCALVIFHRFYVSKTNFQITIERVNTKIESLKDNSSDLEARIHSIERACERLEVLGTESRKSINQMLMTINTTLSNIGERLSRIEGSLDK